MYVLEKKYGNDGYAFWFKLLELLGDTENHFIDCNDPSQWEFLIAKSHVDTEMAENILQTLQNLGAIDRDLWDKKVIWSENFVFNLSTVYNRREVSAYNKPEVWDFCKHKYNWNSDSVNINPKDVNINPQREEKERKGKKRILPLGEFKNIILLEEEFEKLKTQFGEKGTNDRIENLSQYIASKGKKYKSHYATILTWERKNNPGSKNTEISFNWENEIR